MSDKDFTNAIYNNFIDQVYQLLDDILRIVPHDPDVKKLKNYIIGIKKVNPKLIITSWHNSVTTKYKNEIDAGDYDFAINKDYKQELSNHYDKGSSDYKYFDEIIDKIRSIVKELSPDNRDKLIKYIQNLSNLTTIYFNANNKLIDKQYLIFIIIIVKLSYLL